MKNAFLFLFDWIWFGPYTRKRKLKRVSPDLYALFFPPGDRQRPAPSRRRWSERFGQNDG